MKLYLTHPSNYDYQTELYQPLKASLGKTHDIFFPHDEHPDGVLSKDIIPACDYVLAEVSEPSTGQGIELGWASAAGMPIVCFHRQGTKVSSSLRFITNQIFEYTDSEDMLATLSSALAAPGAL
jgi:hypothetical protein